MQAGGIALFYWFLKWEMFHFNSYQQKTLIKVKHSPFHKRFQLLIATFTPHSPALNSTSGLSYHKAFNLDTVTGKCQEFVSS
jgi:hypothetical protein